jgi:hypothetical protein
VQLRALPGPLRKGEQLPVYISWLALSLFLS